MTNITPVAPTLAVVGLGHAYGGIENTTIAETGPAAGTSKHARTGTVVAAWDVSFDVAGGEALGVIGESGSGKSTVMKSIAGDITPTTGRVTLRRGDGTTAVITEMSPAEIRALRVNDLSIVHQNPADGLDLRITAGGNIADRLTAAGWRNFAAIRERAAELLTRTEVPLDRMDDPVGSFSGGMRQRVQLAKALANTPSVVLLDEPTTGLDASIAAGVLDLIRGLLDEFGLAAVVVSHDFSVIEMLTQRCVVMQHGRVVEHGLTDQLLEDPAHPYSQRLVGAARA